MAYGDRVQVCRSSPSPAVPPGRHQNYHRQCGRALAVPGCRCHRLPNTVGTKPSIRVTPCADLRHLVLPRHVTGDPREMVWGRMWVLSHGGHPGTHMSISQGYCDTQHFWVSISKPWVSIPWFGYDLSVSSQTYVLETLPQCGGSEEEIKT